MENDSIISFYQKILYKYFLYLYKSSALGYTISNPITYLINCDNYWIAYTLLFSLDSPSNDTLQKIKLILISSPFHTGARRVS